ncbi:hypothetical protein T11_7100 [Trichinella zimbabwensis]|uniref:Uncharacterized protein n=1 Tax=Trichinella zimbabwensis TaxID=268475 RepID=A0A0V1HHE8_9BILA|nr:hypothetical protein T11_7100 [Trichinella zimbabwensis]
MQITIAIKVPYRQMEQRKSENADDTKQITDVTKQNKRRQEARLGRHRKVEVIPKIYLQQRSSNALKPVSNAALCK